eukprot:g32122.t1
MVLASPEAAPAEDCGSPGLHAPFAHLEPRLQATLRGFRPWQAELALDAVNSSRECTTAGSGQWQVHTVKRGWATLTPALQGALTEAMSQSQAWRIR